LLPIILLIILNLTEEVNKVNNKSGKDLIDYEGRSFLAVLIKQKLIDKFHFFENPVVTDHALATA